MSIFEVLFSFTLLVYTAPQIMVFCAVDMCMFHPWFYRYRCFRKPATNHSNINEYSGLSEEV